MIKFYGLSLLLLLSSTLAFGQTKGLIYKPASTSAGRAVLDPNGDSYSSASTAGYMNNDWGWGESEIKTSPFLSLKTNLSRPHYAALDFVTSLDLRSINAGLYEPMMNYRFGTRGSKIVTPGIFNPSYYTA